MPQYVIRSIHTSDQCPSANSKVRERLGQAGGQMPHLAQQAGVKILTGPLVLADEHESVVVVEADSIEAVGRFVRTSGLAQWNSVRVSPAQPLQEAMAEIDQLPPPLY